MKTFHFAIFPLILATVSASAITVTTPSNGAQVQTPFQLIASTESCDGKKAVTMGYSIDDGPTTVVPTSFTALVSAPAGNHLLHVKCLGDHVHDHKILSITVTTGTPPTQTTATPSVLPAGGTYSSGQTVTLSDATPGATIYYSTDDTVPTAQWPQYTSGIAVNSSTVIYAIAVAPGYSQSGLETASYTISPTGPTGPTPPPNAIAVSDIQLLPNWIYHHDPGTVGSSVGSLTLVSEPSLTGQTAKFQTSFEDWGGEIYSRSYANDENAMNFLYDSYVWIDGGSLVGNLEMDNNQVIPDGDTVIYGFQCDGDHNSWDYSGNIGTPSQPKVRWQHSNQPCDPRNWTPNAWHHVQISYSRDDVGNVTYHSVWLDGVEAPINQTILSAFSLGWGRGDLMTNFQVDGVGPSGQSVLYVDNMTFYRW